MEGKKGIKEDERETVDIFGRKYALVNFVILYDLYDCMTVIQS